MKDFPTISTEQTGREWSAKHLHTPEVREKVTWFDWWYRLTAPPVPSPTASLEERETARQGRLTSLILFFMILIALGLALPVGIFQNHLLVPVVLVLTALMCYSLWFNRRGKTIIAGSIVTAVMSIGIPIAILTTPGGLGVNSTYLYDMMLQSDLIAASLLPPRSVFVMAAFNVLFTLVDFNLQPHTAELNALVAKVGPELLARPIVLHVITAVVLYLWVRSAVKAIRRADRAEVIATLEHDIAAQNVAIAQQKRKLDASIQQIVQTLTYVANGNHNARVPLAGENVLWEIAGTLNNLLARFQQLRHVEVHMQRVQPWLQHAQQVEQEFLRIQKETDNLVLQLQQAKKNHRPISAPLSRTMLSALLVELNGYTLTSVSRQLQSLDDLHIIEQ